MTQTTSSDGKANRKGPSFGLGLFLGLAAGLVAGLLLAPGTGGETRAIVGKAIGDAAERISEGCCEDG